MYIECFFDVLEKVPSFQNASHCVETFCNAGIVTRDRRIGSIITGVDFTTEKSAGLPYFSWYKIPKREKYTKMTTKYTKWP
jgi:hypothetical protein